MVLKMPSKIDAAALTALTDNAKIQNALLREIDTFSLNITPKVKDYLPGLLDNGPYAYYRPNSLLYIYSRSR